MMKETRYAHDFDCWTDGCEYRLPGDFGSFRCTGQWRHARRSCRRPRDDRPVLRRLPRLWLWLWLLAVWLRRLRLLAVWLRPPLLICATKPPFAVGGPRPRGLGSPSASAL